MSCVQHPASWLVLVVSKCPNGAVQCPFEAVIVFLIFCHQLAIFIKGFVITTLFVSRLCVRLSPGSEPWDVLWLWQWGQWLLRMWQL